MHHAIHVLATGESDGYYADYGDDAAMPRRPPRGFTLVELMVSVGICSLVLIGLAALLFVTSPRFPGEPPKETVDVDEPSASTRSA